MSTTKNSKNQIKRTLGLVLFLIGLVILVIVPSSSGSGPAPLAFWNRNDSSTQVGHSEATQWRQPDANTIGYHFTATAPVDLSAGLIGHWPLDGNADDTSGNGHNGTISGATPTTGMFGGAYNFNGSASIDVGNLDFSSGQFTVSSWIRTDLPAVTESWKDWLTKLDVPSGTGPFMLFLGDGRVVGGGGNGPGLAVWENGVGVVDLYGANLNYRDGNWHHVAVTYQNGSQKLYADGVLMYSSAYPGPLPSNSSSVMIGGIEGFGPYHHRWVGDIDEVSIYSRVLDCSEIAALFNGGAGQCNDADGDGVFTGQGTNVVVQPLDANTNTAPATLTFSQVTQAGSTSLAISSSGPTPPSGFQLGTPPTFYELTTTASFSGPVAVCVDYSAVSFPDESQLGLFHYENGSWIDRTTSLDTTNKIICGDVTSLSPFAIFKGGIASLIQQVASLNLNKGEKKSLTTELEAAKQALIRGNHKAASNQMNAFINDVRAFKRSGRLSSAVADSLILQAQGVLTTI